MPKPLTLRGIVSSLRRGSYNRAARVAAQGLVPPGVTLALRDPASVPPFNRDTGGSPTAGVVALKRCIRAADAVLVAWTRRLSTAPAWAE